MNKLQPLSYQSTSNIIPRLPLHTSQPTPQIYNATALITRPYIYAQIYAPTASCSIGKKKKILLPTHLGETRKTFTVSEAWRDCFCAVNELMNVPENSLFAVKRVHRNDQPKCPQNLSSVQYNFAKRNNLPPSADVIVSL